MKISKIFATIVATALISGGYALAEEKAAEHDHNHADAQATAPAGDAKKGGMMMDMEGMMGMMHQCMEMHKGKGGKMCDHEMMQKCETSNMKKGECQKIMKQAKAKMKEEKK